MHPKKRVPAIENWYTMDSDKPHLIGSCCDQCGTYYFPKQFYFCKNPQCEGTQLSEIPLSRHGKIWSYTNACYRPPEPYQSNDPFEPFTLAAVKLKKEQMIIMGQMTNNISIKDLCIGDDVELVIDTLHEDDTSKKTIWKWSPLQKNFTLKTAN